MLCSRFAALLCQSGVARVGRAIEQARARFRLAVYEAAKVRVVREVGSELL